MITVRSVTPEDYSGIILLLRKYFFPHEPAAVGLDLCPKGKKTWCFIYFMFYLSRKTRKPVKTFSKKEKLKESETKTVLTPGLHFLPTISFLFPKKILIKRQNSKKFAFLINCLQRKIL